MIIIPSEHDEQVILFQEMALRAKQDPRWGKAFAIPNGGLRNIVVAKKLKAEGVRAGTPDIFIPVPAGPYCGMFLEMKRRAGGVVSSEQWAFMNSMHPHYFTAVGYGAADAIERIATYFAAGGHFV